MIRKPGRAPGPRSFALATAAALLAAWGISKQMEPARADEGRAGQAPAEVWQEDSAQDWTKPTEDSLHRTLTDLQYRVTQRNGTEPPFRNEYWNKKEHGIYVDIVSGEPLFSSLDKYGSGTGWPSFVRTIEPGILTESTDHDLGYPRTEIRSRLADSHLGHVFPDGPPPTGDRYCINSAALRFVPVADLAVRGYGRFLPAFVEAGVAVEAGTAGERTEVAILAGGCYWGMEELLRDVPGVLDTEVGFCGDTLANAKYEDVVRRDTGHAESVRVLFDPDRLSYAQLLDRYFRIHDPTTVNRQGNDRGAQYRSAVFVIDAKQREIAERVKAEWNASGRWKSPLVTEITDAGEFWPAKEAHQDYLEKHPNGYTCHFVRDWDE